VLDHANGHATLSDAAATSAVTEAPPAAAMVQLELHLETFDGPLELLLLLIEQRRLPITQVSLAQVADQYLAQVHALPVLDPDLLADFLSVASKLLLLKSRALLLNEEPDPAVEEVASDLAERLVTYRVFRAAAEALRELEQRGGRMYPTQREPLVTTAPAPLAPVAPDTLYAVWRRLSEPTGPAPDQLELPLLVRISVDERRAAILDALRDSPSVAFRVLCGTTVDSVIATFLAVLELFRRGRLDVNQPTPFGDLLLLRPRNSAV
jgi:segregation and condensation protein A